VLIGAWRTDAAMRAHFSSPAYGTYVETVTDLLTRPSDVVIHSVAGTVHPLPDLSLEPGRAS
jgi:quinol monooxygenase YgiN